MYFINENDVLDYYVKLLNEQKISFLKGKPQVTERLIKDLQGLRKENEMHLRTYTIEIKRKFAQIRIDGELQDIPSYLKSSEFFSSEEYTLLGE